MQSRSEEHTSELQSLRQLVCRLLLEKKIAAGQERSFAARQLLRAGVSLSPPGRRAASCMADLFFVFLWAPDAKRFFGSFFKGCEHPENSPSSLSGRFPL